MTIIHKEKPIFIELNLAHWLYHMIVFWKESLNSDGHKFYQYQQHEKLPLTFTIKRKIDHDIWQLKSNPWLGTGTNIWRGETI